MKRLKEAIASVKTEGAEGDKLYKKYLSAAVAKMSHELIRAGKYNDDDVIEVADSIETFCKGHLTDMAQGMIAKAAGLDPADVYDDTDMTPSQKGKAGGRRTGGKIGVRNK